SGNFPFSPREYKAFLVGLHPNMDIQERIFSIDSADTFNELCLEVYRFQKAHCALYSRYLDLLGKTETDVRHYTQIPFLPIDFFKTKQVLGSGKQAEIICSSAGTTGMVASQHQVAELAWYGRSFRSGFQRLYGAVEDIAILALLRSYLERSGSSLVDLLADLFADGQH